MNHSLYIIVLLLATCCKIKDFNNMLFNFSSKFATMCRHWHNGKEGSQNDTYNAMRRIKEGKVIRINFGIYISSWL